MTTVPSNQRYIHEEYARMKHAIRERLFDFTTVPQEEYFYELCYCICTPQSKAVSAFAVVEELKRFDFEHTDIDVVPLLRSPSHYIRFHNTKARNLIGLKTVYPTVKETLISTISPVEKRDVLVSLIRGVGMKEASHFMRNIGYRELCIIDRHILKHLYRCGVIDSLVFPSSKKKYLDMEHRWKQFAHDIRIPVDELDLLFWSLETGEILK
ncbi:MAG: DNA lyase [Candidatus Kapabacteria bacterium]|nr:DNA lyase [Candidatus Kapabacteria bacterium]